MKVCLDRFGLATVALDIFSFLTKHSHQYHFLKVYNVSFSVAVPSIKRFNLTHFEHVDDDIFSFKSDQDLELWEYAMWSIEGYSRDLLTSIAEYSISNDKCRFMIGTNWILKWLLEFCFLTYSILIKFMRTQCLVYHLFNFYFSIFGIWFVVWFSSN